MSTDIDSVHLNPVKKSVLHRGAEIVATHKKFALYRVPEILPFQVWAHGIYVSGFKTQEQAERYLKK